MRIDIPYYIFINATDHIFILDPIIISFARKSSIEILLDIDGEHRSHCAFGPAIISSDTKPNAKPKYHIRGIVLPHWKWMNLIKNYLKIH